MKVKEVAAEHTYKFIDEIDSFGFFEFSHHYNLKVSCKDENGKSINFHAYLSEDTESKTPFVSVRWE